MAKKNEVVTCNTCGEERPVEPHPTQEGRVIAYCSCIGKRRAVYEGNAAPVLTVKEASNDST